MYCIMVHTYLGTTCTIYMHHNVCLYLFCCKRGGIRRVESNFSACTAHLLPSFRAKICVCSTICYIIVYINSFQKIFSFLLLYLYICIVFQSQQHAIQILNATNGNICMSFAIYRDFLAILVEEKMLYYVDDDRICFQKNCSLCPFNVSSLLDQCQISIGSQDLTSTLLLQYLCNVHIGSTILYKT